MVTIFLPQNPLKLRWSYLGHFGTFTLPTFYKLICFMQPLWQSNDHYSWHIIIFRPLFGINFQNFVLNRLKLIKNFSRWKIFFHKHCLRTCAFFLMWIEGYNNYSMIVRSWCIMRIACRLHNFMYIGPGALACATRGGRSEAGHCFHLLFFLSFFSSLFLGTLPCLKICFPQYFGITRRNI